MVHVRSGIRTHAHRSGLRPERSALDHSAILTLCCTAGLQSTMAVLLKSYCREAFQVENIKNDKCLDSSRGVRGYFPESRKTLDISVK